MNISEFERTKPEKAYNALQKLIKKYTAESLVEAADEAEGVTASVLVIQGKMAQEVKDDLLKFKEIFLTGE